MAVDERAFKAAIDEWGSDAQLRMVGEEATELSLAIYKLLRARAKVRGLRPDMSDIERLAVEHDKALDAVVSEACDVWIMLEQLKVLIPTNWGDEREKTYQRFLEKLKFAGVALP